MTDESTQRSTQLRRRFSDAIAAEDFASVGRMLTEDSWLANADLRPPDERDEFTQGYPLYLACQRGLERIVSILLEHGANPDAPSSAAQDPPELGMPLHFAVCEGNFSLAHLLLDRGASPHGYPHCDQATVERSFYQARDAGITDQLVRRAYARWLPDRHQLESQDVVDLIDADAAAPLRFFTRMLAAGGQPPFCALVREGFDDLVLEIVHHSANVAGTRHDHPNSSVFNNIYGVARWYGYPRLFRRLMKECPERFDYDSAVDTIGVAIGSHNRDGGYAEYREIVVMQLEHLTSRGQLQQAIEDVNFQPLYQMATDFCWHSNYGFKAEIVKPECYIDLAELFVSYGFDDINHRDPETNHSALSAAVKRGHHPGITTYIRWLLDHGADLRSDDSDEVDPCTIAKTLGFEEILAILNNETE